jgi:hypothetical protein
LRSSELIRDRAAALSFSANIGAPASSGVASKAWNVYDSNLIPQHLNHDKLLPRAAFLETHHYRNLRFVAAPRGVCDNHLIRLAKRLGQT